MLLFKRCTPVYDITTSTKIILQNSDKRREKNQSTSSKKPDIEKYSQHKSLLKVFTCDQLRSELAGEINKLQRILKQTEISQQF